MTLYIILIAVVIAASIGIVICVYYNKFQLAIIKIDEAENNIDILLEKKHDLIDRCRPTIKKELKLKDFLNDIDLIKEKNYNHFEKNNSLKKCYNDLFKELDDNDKLYKNEGLLKIIENINVNEENLIASIKFYNDSVVTFNHLISSFPSNFIKLLFGYKRKEFYSHEKREIYEILKK